VDPDNSPEHILPVTFVGPARVGSTHSIILALNQFPGIGVAACSITLLDDLAFIHLQLALPHGVSIGLTKGNTVGLDPSTFMKEVLGPALRPHRKFVGNDIADDYQTLAGPQLDYVHPDRQRRLAIWFSWQMNRTPEGLWAPLDSLSAALDSIGIGWNSRFHAPTANIEYLVCRDLGNSVLRSKGKLSVPYSFVADAFPRRGVEPSASQLCVALEDAWKNASKAVAAKSKPAANIREITVSWREYWLGHWAAPIT
jgi:hypothetical protein